MNKFDLDHGLKVAAQLAETSDEEWLAGLLHDVIEDTDYTAADLLAFGVPPEAVRIIEVLTRGNETYADYIGRVCEDPQARVVKLADLRANLARMDAEHQGLFSRYTKAHQRLQARQAEAEIA